MLFEASKSVAEYCAPQGMSTVFSHSTMVSNICKVTHMLFLVPFLVHIFLLLTMFHLYVCYRGEDSQIYKLLALHRWYCNSIIGFIQLAYTSVAVVHFSWRFVPCFVLCIIYFLKYTCAGR